MTIEIDRTSIGLRNMLFDEIDRVRRGKSNPRRANAIARLSSGILEIVKMEIEVANFIDIKGREAICPIELDQAVITTE